MGRIPGSPDRPSHDPPVLLLGGINHRAVWIEGARGRGSQNSDTHTRPCWKSRCYRLWSVVSRSLVATDYILRSLYVGSGSGEEHGLVGSTGWVEFNMERRKTTSTVTATATIDNNKKYILPRSLVYCMAAHHPYSPDGNPYSRIEKMYQYHPHHHCGLVVLVLGTMLTIIVLLWMWIVVLVLVLVLV